MIVMNGFRILQSHNGQGWETVGTIKKVEKGIVAGVYNLFLSKVAEANNTVYEGIILYIDKEKEIVLPQNNLVLIEDDILVLLAKTPDLEKFLDKIKM